MGDLTYRELDEVLGRGVEDESVQLDGRWGAGPSLPMAGLLGPAPGVKAAGSRRPEIWTAPALAGMMLHQDASTHEWVPGRWWDLIVTMDDATSDIHSAFFVEEEAR